MEGASITPGRLGTAAVVLVLAGTVGIFNEGSARSMVVAAYLLMAGGVAWVRLLSQGYSLASGGCSCSSSRSRERSCAGDR